MKKKALIIEDNISDQILNKATLECLEFECIVVPDGEMAISQIVSQKFDLILLDLEMPNISGIQFLMGFRSAFLNKDIPVVVVSSKEDTNSKELAEKFGAKDFIQKPLNMNNHRSLLLNAIKSHNSCEVVYD